MSSTVEVPIPQPQHHDCPNPLLLQQTTANSDIIARSAPITDSSEQVKEQYVNPVQVIWGHENYPRFGYTNDLNQHIITNIEASSSSSSTSSSSNNNNNNNNNDDEYVQGLIAMSIIMGIFFVIWAGLLLYLKFYYYNSNKSSSPFSIFGGQPLKESSPPQPPEYPRHSNYHNQNNDEGGDEGDDDQQPYKYVPSKKYAKSSSKIKGCGDSNKQQENRRQKVLMKDPRLDNNLTSRQVKQYESQYHKYKHKYSNWKANSQTKRRRLRIMRIITILGCIIIIVCTLIFIVQATDVVLPAITTTQDIISNTQLKIHDGLNLIDTYLNQYQEFTKPTTESYLKDHIDTYCPNHFLESSYTQSQRPSSSSSTTNLCTDILAGYDCNYNQVPYSILVRDILDYILSLKETLVQDIMSFSKDLSKIGISKLDNYEDNLNSYKWTLYVAIAFSMVLALITMYLLIGIFFAWSNTTSLLPSIFERARSNIILPIFLLLVFGSWGFSMAFVISTISVSDFCYETPDTKVMSLIKQQAYPPSSTTSSSSVITRTTNNNHQNNIFVDFSQYYISGCSDSLLPNHFTDKMQLIFTSIDKLATFRHTTTIDPTEYQKTCGINPNEMAKASEDVEQQLCTTANELHNIQNFFASTTTCTEDWYPFYTQSIYEEICYNTTNGLSWLSITQCIIIFVSIIVLTFRVSFYEIEILPPPEDGNEEEIIAEQRPLIVPFITPQPTRKPDPPDGVVDTKPDPPSGAVDTDSSLDSIEISLDFDDDDDDDVETGTVAEEEEIADKGATVVLAAVPAYDRARNAPTSSPPQQQQQQQQQKQGSNKSTPDTATTIVHEQKQQQQPMQPPMMTKTAASPDHDWSTVSAVPAAIDDYDEDASDSSPLLRALPPIQQQQQQQQQQMATDDSTSGTYGLVPMEDVDGCTNRDEDHGIDMPFDERNLEPSPQPLVIVSENEDQAKDVPDDHVMLLENENSDKPIIFDGGVQEDLEQPVNLLLSTPKHEETSMDEATSPRPSSPPPSSSPPSSPSTSLSNKIEPPSPEEEDQPQSMTIDTEGTESPLSTRIDAEESSQPPPPLPPFERPEPSQAEKLLSATKQEETIMDESMPPPSSPESASSPTTPSIDEPQAVMIEKEVAQSPVSTTTEAEKPTSPPPMPPPFERPEPEQEAKLLSAPAKQEETNIDEATPPSPLPPSPQPASPPIKNEEDEEQLVVLGTENAPPPPKTDPEEPTSPPGPLPPFERPEQLQAETASTQSESPRPPHPKKPVRKFGGDRVDCFACKKRVYPLEAVKVDSYTYHKTCMRCTHCGGQVGLKGLAMIDGEIYCKPHFKELFKQSGGRYDSMSKKPLTEPAGTSDSIEANANNNIGEQPKSEPTKSPASPPPSEYSESVPPVLISNVTENMVDPFESPPELVATPSGSVEASESSPTHSEGIGEPPFELPSPASSVASDKSSVKPYTAIFRPPSISSGSYSSDSDKSSVSSSQESTTEISVEQENASTAAPDGTDTSVSSGGSSLASSLWEAPSHHHTPSSDDRKGTPWTRDGGITAEPKTLEIPTLEPIIVNSIQMSEPSVGEYYQPDDTSEIEIESVQEQPKRSLDPTSKLQCIDGPPEELNLPDYARQSAASSSGAASPTLSHKSSSSAGSSPKHTNRFRVDMASVSSSEKSYVKPPYLPPSVASSSPSSNQSPVKPYTKIFRPPSISSNSSAASSGSSPPVSPVKPFTNIFRPPSISSSSSISEKSGASAETRSTTSRDGDLHHSAVSALSASPPPKERKTPAFVSVVNDEKPYQSPKFERAQSLPPPPPPSSEELAKQLKSPMLERGVLPPFERPSPASSASTVSSVKPFTNIFRPPSISSGSSSESDKSSVKSLTSNSSSRKSKSSSRSAVMSETTEPLPPFERPSPVSLVSDTSSVKPYTNIFRPPSISSGSSSDSDKSSFKPNAEIFSPPSPSSSSSGSTIASKKSLDESDHSSVKPYTKIFRPPSISSSSSTASNNSDKSEESSVKPYTKIFRPPSISSGSSSGSDKSSKSGKSSTLEKSSFKPYTKIFRPPSISSGSSSGSDSSSESGKSSTNKSSSSSPVKPLTKIFRPPSISSSSSGSSSDDSKSNKSSTHDDASISSDISDISGISLPPMMMRKPAFVPLLGSVKKKKMQEEEEEEEEPPKPKAEIQMALESSSKPSKLRDEEEGNTKEEEDGDDVEATTSQNSQSTNKAAEIKEDDHDVEEWNPMLGASMYTANQEVQKKEAEAPAVPEWNPMVGASVYTANQGPKTAAEVPEWDPMVGASVYTANQEPSTSAAAASASNGDDSDEEKNHFADRFKKTESGKVKWGKQVKTKVPDWKRMYSY